jgi:L-ribulose-5-phosphate 3-epimerase
VYPALNAWTFSDNTPPDEQLALAAAAGFAGVELVVSDTGPLRPDTPLPTFAEIARRAADVSGRIVSLATALFWQFNYASPAEADRRRAGELTLQMLDRAAAARAGAILVVPAVVGRVDERRPRVAYADALHRTLETLLTLRHEAEARGVILALENVWNRFLLSPVELADLIDLVNSPYVAVYFDVGNVLACGYPEDWIATLGGRIARVHVRDYDLGGPGPAGFCPLGAGSVDWPAVIAALREAGYDGPLTYEGLGDPHDIGRRLRNILAGRPVASEEPT